ncbi:MAG: adenine deaminase, partial [Thermoproteota archaeon]
LEVRNGVVQRDLGRGINKVAIVDRFGRSIGISFWKVGYKEGAVAMSILHDSHNISVIGATDEEMALAVNRVFELGGGIVIVKGKKVLAEVSLPIGGLMTDRPPDEVVKDLEFINEKAKMLKPDPSLGPHPIDTQTFMFLTCYPRKIMLTAKGLINLQTGEKIPSVW